MTPEQRAEQLSEQLNLTDAQKSKVADIYQSSMQRMQAMFAGGGGRGGSPGGGSDMRQRMMRLFNEVNEEIAEILDPEQRAKFEEMNAMRGGNRQSVYVLTETGSEERKTIMIGLQDDNMAEVVSGLDEGDMVIVRAKRVTS